MRHDRPPRSDSTPNGVFYERPIFEIRRVSNRTGTGLFRPWSGTQCATTRCLSMEHRSIQYQVVQDGQSIRIYVDRAHG
jgi:hypothetical protein